MGNASLRTRQECEDLVRGLCFRGAGGGGPPSSGLKLLLHQLEAGRGLRGEAIVPGETGGSAVPAALAAALEFGVPVVDGDYAGGRAIPEVPQALPELKGIPVCPLSFVPRWGAVVNT